MKINEILKDFLIMPQTIKPMGLIHKPGTGPNNRFDFINKANNRGNETKEAPPGTYFTKTGNLVKGRLTKAAKSKGARETDPKDSQRSKVPPVTQSNEARGTCWHGYQQKGYKKKGNKMVPNCVPKNEETEYTGPNKEDRKQIKKMDHSIYTLDHIKMVYLMLKNKFLIERTQIQTQEIK